MRTEAENLTEERREGGRKIILLGPLKKNDNQCCYKVILNELLQKIKTMLAPDTHASLWAVLPQEARVRPTCKIKTGVRDPLQAIEFKPLTLHTEGEYLSHSSCINIRNISLLCKFSRSRMKSKPDWRSDVKSQSRAMQRRAGSSKSCTISLGIVDATD